VGKRAHRMNEELERKNEVQGRKIIGRQTRSTDRARDGEPRPLRDQNLEQKSNLHAGNSAVTPYSLVKALAATMDEEQTQSTLQARTSSRTQRETDDEREETGDADRKMKHRR
jgi:hypothetical protein